MKTLMTAVLIGLALLAETSEVHAATVTLYDGTGAPAAQPWLTFTNAGGTQTAGSGPVNLNTLGNNAFYAGYSNYSVNPAGPAVGSLKNNSFPVLDPIAGYTLNFTVQILSQVNASPNRAGFSVIALSNNNQGIEIGFRSADIFSQSTSFTVAEQNTSPSIATLTAALTSYSLNILGSTYTLSNGGNTLLTGALRNYSSFGAPYTTPNFIFLGDDTTSASAAINLGAVSLTTGSAAGVPFGFSPTLGLVALATWGGVYQWRKQKAVKR